MDHKANVVETREYPQGQSTLRVEILDNGYAIFAPVPAHSSAGLSSTVLRQLADLVDAARRAT